MKNIFKSKFLIYSYAQFNAYLKWERQFRYNFISLLGQIIPQLFSFPNASFLFINDVILEKLGSYN